MQVKMVSNCVAGCGIIAVNTHKVGMISADDTRLFVAIQDGRLKLESSMVSL